MGGGGPFPKPRMGGTVEAARASVTTARRMDASGRTLRWWHLQKVDVIGKLKYRRRRYNMKI